MSVFSYSFAVGSGNSNLSLLYLNPLLKECQKHILQDKPSVHNGKCEDDLGIFLKYCRHNLKHVRRGELKCRIYTCEKGRAFHLELTLKISPESKLLIGGKDSYKIGTGG